MEVFFPRGILHLTQKKTHKSIDVNNAEKKKKTALKLAHSQVYSTAWECVRMIRCDSFSEIPQLRRDEQDGEECDAKN